MRATRIRVAWSQVPHRLRVAILVIAALGLSTAAIWILEQVVNVPYASPVYLVAVLVAGVIGGTTTAIAAAVASFLLYDFLFVLPLYTFTVSDPNEWLNLLLFLAVAIVISRLAALQAERTREATDRAREAQALFRVTRTLAVSRSLDEAAGVVMGEIAASSAMDRVWLGLGPTPGEERVVADTRLGEPLPSAPIHVVLEGSPGDTSPRWSRTHVATAPWRGDRRSPGTVYRVGIILAGEILGSLWALRVGDKRDPDPPETRIIAAAADQLGQAVRHDRMVAETLRAEVARQSDALKTALLDSVSHDLRTPLATIRATAGSLLDHEVEWTPDERDEALKSIDAEAERMNRLVRNLLDLSRIEGGALRPDLEPHDVDACLEPVIRRISTQKRITVDLATDLPPILADDSYIDEVLTNLVENAVRYGGETIRVSAEERPSDGTVVIAVEDDGAGVPDADRARLFEKFYRVPAREGSRRGMGIGLTVARGLTQAMGGSIVAERSDLGGLAFRVTLPAARRPAVETASDSGPGDSGGRRASRVTR